MNLAPNLGFFALIGPILGVNSQSYRLDVLSEVDIFWLLQYSKVFFLLKKIKGIFNKEICYK